MSGSYGDWIFGRDSESIWDIQYFFALKRSVRVEIGFEAMISDMHKISCTCLLASALM